MLKVYEGKEIRELFLKCLSEYKPWTPSIVPTDCTPYVLTTDRGIWLLKDGDKTLWETHINRRKHPSQRELMLMAWMMGWRYEGEQVYRK